MTNRIVDAALANGDYLATCREIDQLRAAINGYGAVYPSAKMTVHEGRATFTRDGVAVWSCSSRYASDHFIIQSVPRTNF